MGVYLSQPKTTKETKTETSGGVRYTSTEMQGWRKNMEDSKITELQVKGANGKNYCVFGVFDGHGGISRLSSGTEVSKFVEVHFVAELARNEEFLKGNIEAALEQTFYRMDELLQTTEGANELNEIRRKYQSEGNNAGCTANVLVFDDENYYVANAGDSRSALCRAGKLVVLSEDHKPECNIEKTRIEKAGGVIMNGRVNGGLNLTRAIGDFQYKSNSSLPYKEQMITCHPDVKKVARHPDDEFIIMGCDGIWERYVNDSQQMINDLIEKRKHQKVSTKLMEDLLDGLLAKNTMEELGCDNMTAVLIEFLKA